MTGLRARCPQCANEIGGLPPVCTCGDANHRSAVLCPTCRALLVWADGALRNPTDAEFADAMGNPNIQYGIRKLAELHNKGLIR